MIPRLPRARSGITLTEILISIAILGIGMISLAVLFPIGLLRLQAAARLSRGTYLVESAIDDISTRNLLYAPTFSSALNPAPTVQDTPLGTGAVRIVGRGLPFAYDPLWYYQTPNPSGYPGRFGYGIGTVNPESGDGGTPSAYGLQRLTNLAAGSPSIPDIFVSPEDVVFVSDDSPDPNAVNSSPIVPNLSLPTYNPNTGVTTVGLPINDWRFSWFFTGQQSDASNGAVFDGDIVICENRQFGIAAAAGGNYQVTGETVVEGVFGWSATVATNTAGNGAGGYGISGSRTVLLRWSSGMDDPEVKVGSWLADVTYERYAATDATKMLATYAADPPQATMPFAFKAVPMQRCYWYQVGKKSPAGPDQLGVSGMRSMTVWTTAALRAQTLLSTTGSPIYANAALIMPSVVNVYSHTFYSR